MRTQCLALSQFRLCFLCWTDPLFCWATSVHTQGWEIQALGSRAVEVHKTSVPCHSGATSFQQLADGAALCETHGQIDSRHVALGLFSIHSEILPAYSKPLLQPCATPLLTSADLERSATTTTVHAGDLARRLWCVPRVKWAKVCIAQLYCYDSSAPALAH